MTMKIRTQQTSIAETIPGTELPLFSSYRRLVTVGLRERSQQTLEKNPRSLMWVKDPTQCTEMVLLDKRHISTPIHWAKLPLPSTPTKASAHKPTSYKAEQQSQAPDQKLNLGQFSSCIFPPATPDFRVGKLIPAIA